jgi:hypothetical protein
LVKDETIKIVIRSGLVVHLELKSVKKSVVSANSTIPVERTNPGFSLNGYVLRRLVKKV